MTPHPLRRKGIKRATKARKRPTKLPSISKLIKTADALFSAKVRQIKPLGVQFVNIVANDSYFFPNKEKIDVNQCFTCEGYFPVKKLHCGHYLSRYYKSARWDYDNARPQCMMCNLWKRGDPIVFRQNLIAEIGEERVKQVEAKRSVSLKLSREYLTNLINSLQ